MAMNSIGWAPNWFGFEVSEMERQISNWCNLNANETFQVVFDIRDIKAFLKANKLHRFTNGKRYVLYTKKRSRSFCSSSSFSSFPFSITDLSIFVIMPS